MNKGHGGVIQKKQLYKALKDKLNYMAMAVRNRPCLPFKSFKNKQLSVVKPYHLGSCWGHGVIKGGS